ncbi:MAG: hypothetical protein M3362_01540 [Acidobacteriota bacterium]|nr:hypothetical protein [Acidobacteriota bacterium]
MMSCFVSGAGRRVIGGVRRRYDERAQGFEEPVWLRRSAPRAGFGGSWTPPNKRMHATRDTNHFMLRGWLGRARDARR